jgi:hypothetical protein
MQRATIQAVKGGVTVTTGGQVSQTIVEGSFPGCTVSVFNTGTVNLTTIYGDNLNPPTPKANPFTADANGFGFFYAANGSRVDVQLSGTGVTTPFIVAGDILLDDPSLLAVLAPQTVVFSATPTFDLSQASWFKLTLTGNVTGPVFSNPVTGSILLLSLTQNAVGGFTFAFPGSFTDPPAIALAANAHTELIFKYDGTNWTQVAATGDSLQVPTTANIVGTLIVGGLATLASLSVTGNATVTGTLGVTGAVTLTVPLARTSGGTGISSTATFPASGTIDTGTGTTNKLPKFTTGASGIIGDSSITDNGTAVSSTLPFTLTPTLQSFTGSGTFTIPTGVTAVKVTLVGGGGAGGGSTAANNGGGGGAGGIAVKFLSSLTPGNTIAVTVGAGGTGVSAAGGNNGSASTIASGTQVITTVTANGGSGGSSSGTASAGGNGAAISTNGDINGAGAPGANSSTGNLGGWGGATFLGGPGGTAAGAAGNNAVANTGSGGGGGGAAGNAAGGNGAAGIVIFEWVK